MTTDQLKTAIIRLLEELEDCEKLSNIFQFVWHIR